jgi:SAM-dependent methyltransferase
MSNRWFIRPGYASRDHPEYFDDNLQEQSGIVHQPDVYPFAFRLAAMWGRHTVIDIGCGRAQKLVVAHPHFDLIGVDIAENFRFCESTYEFGKWIESDLESGEPLPVESRKVADSVVVCSDVIEHLSDPGALLSVLSGLVQQGALLVMSTPERDRVRGCDDPGPPANPAHVREWALDEFHQLLAWSGLEPDFIGLTRNNDRDSLKRTILAVVDGSRPQEPAAASFEVLAVVTAYNEADVIETTIDHLRNQGAAVHVIDNWSTDATFDLLAQKAERKEISVERFPPSGPTGTYDWSVLLERVSEVGMASAADWVIHHDADEIRQSPWPEISLRDALWGVDRAGFNAIDHTVIEFWPTPGKEHLPLPERRHFIFGSRPGHFQQIKGWKRAAGPGRLVDSGGHDINLPNQRVFPHKFLLRHYPVRSQEHGERKIFRERKARWNLSERQERGWHYHYEKYEPGDAFIRLPADMLEFDEVGFCRDYVTERLSGVNLPGTSANPWLSV